MQIFRFENNKWENEFGEPSLNSSELLDQSYINGNGFGNNKKPTFFNNFMYTMNRFKRSQRPDWPSARYGHAATMFKDGFVIYGGTLNSDNLSNELWFYNISTSKWNLRAISSNIQPPALTRHTITSVDNFLYLFGGVMENGEFSEKLYRIELSENNENDNWIEVIPRGGKLLDLRLAGHTTSYYPRLNSLVVYGGLIVGVARFSKLSDKMFFFQLDHLHWTEISFSRSTYPRNLPYIPKERAFHSSVILGNYMIVFGGYTHRHSNKDEICYDNQMFVYHLGCHSWINVQNLQKNEKSKYPKVQGVFAHSMSLRDDILLVLGGFHGNANGDFLAYVLPKMLNIEKIYDPEKVCLKHSTVFECLTNLDCGWCQVDNACYGRTSESNCTTNLLTTRCPGICGTLNDCHSCLIHGSGLSSEARGKSLSKILGLDKCSWCSSKSKCHQNDNNFICDDTNVQSPALNVLSKCTEYDIKPGLTYLKYYSPVNWTLPDYVTVINTSSIEFSIPANEVGDVLTARLIGFVKNYEKTQNWKACGANINASLQIRSENEETLHNVVNFSSNQGTCKTLNVSKGKVLIDYKGNRISNDQTFSKLELLYETNSNSKIFFLDALEQFSSHSCLNYTTCLHCLSDSACAWCEINEKCLSRKSNESKTCTKDGNWRYLTLNSHQCPNCSNYVDCQKCVKTGICEWQADEARCLRIGRG